MLGYSWIVPFSYMRHAHMFGQASAYTDRVACIQLIYTNILHTYTCHVYGNTSYTIYNKNIRQHIYNTHISYIYIYTCIYVYICINILTYILHTIIHNLLRITIVLHSHNIMYIRVPWSKDNHQRCAGWLCLSGVTRPLFLLRAPSHLHPRKRSIETLGRFPPDFLRNYI